ncbi:MAG: flavodoxin [Pseudobutyrivibrio sp.]|nr:flavodoxin [Pseudobutyrivibrio sp.]
MSKAVRFYSRSGNTKALADAIASGAGVTAVSVDDSLSGINEPVDTLFIGGGLYAYGIDKKLKNYINTLDSTKVKKAAVFSTSWLSKHALDIIKDALKARGIEVVEETCYAKNMPGVAELKAAGEFGAKY